MKRLAFVAVLVVVGVVPVWSPHDVATTPPPYEVACKGGAVVDVDPATPEGLDAAGTACMVVQAVRDARDAVAVRR